MKIPSIEPVRSEVCTSTPRRRALLLYAMRISFTFFLLIFGALQILMAHDGIGQELNERIVTVDARSESLQQVIKKIEQKTGLSFVIPLDEVDQYKKITFSEQKRSVSATLDLALNNTPLGYKLLNNKTVLVYVNKKSNIKLNREGSLSLIETLPAVRQPISSIKGVVRDEKGEALPGVTILLKGTQVGTTSDEKGAFTIDVPSDNSILVFSSVGYTTKEIIVGNRSSLEVSLQADNKSLDEVVVIGYGKVQRRNVTSSIASVDTKNLNVSSASSVDQLLAGRVPGLQAMQTTGQPGAGSRIKIRSVPSPNAAVNVLYIVDGIIINDNATDVSAGTQYGGGGVERSPLNFINPNDVESIEVLKDASALAIYGSRAAGGAIIITTKRGKEGKPKITYNVSHSTQKAQNFYETFDTKEYMEQRNSLLHERWMLTNKLAPYGSGDPAKAPAFKPKFTDSEISNATVYPNALDAIIRTGNTQQHDVAISGGTGKTSYYISGNYFDQKGVIRKTDFKRYSARVNLDQKITDNLTFGVNLTMSNSLANNGNIQNGQNENSGIINAAFYFPPYLPFKDDKGEYVINPDYQAAPNPLSFLEVTDKTRSRRLLTNAYLEWKIIPGLTAKANFGYDQSNAKRDTYLPKTFLTGRKVGGQASIDYKEMDTKTLEYTLNYNKTLGQDHQIDLVGGYTFNKIDGDSVRAYNERFLSDNILYNDLGQGNAIRPVVGSGRLQKLYASYFVRGIYTLKNRYILSLVGRRDGYSYFAKNKKWGFFPGVSVAWIVSDEPFLRDVPQINFLKLRVGYGVIGNNNIGTSGYGFYSIGKSYTFGNAIAQGAYLSQLSNNDLTWEKNSEINVGADLKMFNNRITIAADFFNRTISDLLNKRLLPTDFIIDKVAANVGKTRSRGWELGITTNNIQGASKNGFNWSTTINLSRYYNTWLERDSLTLASLPKYVDPKGSFDAVFGYRADGIMQAGEGVPAHMKAAFPGLIKVKDLNGYDANGNLTGVPDGKLSDADIVQIANNIPRLSFGFGNTFSYRRFDLSIYMYGMIQTKYNSDYSGAFDTEKKLATFGWNVLKVTNEGWTPTNTSAKYPTRLTSPYATYTNNSDFWRENGNFIRCRDITLGYSVPSDILQKTKVLSALRVSANLQNPFIITKYKGMDPELQNFLAYPMTRSFTVGLNATF